MTQETSGMSASSSGLGLARKKVPAGAFHGRDEPEPPTVEPGSRANSIVESNDPYELEWTELREIVDELRDLLPARYKPLLKPMPPACPPTRWSYCIEDLLRALGLPDFSRFDTTHFAKHFAKGVGNREYLLVCLKALLENGIAPLRREGDVDCALWMLQNPIGGTGSSGGTPPREVRVVAEDAIAAWQASHGADIERRVAAYARDGTSNSWSTRGLLRHLGYRVGQQGEAQHVRHGILTSAILLPSRLLPPQHRRNWGEAGTSTRVAEIRRMITLFLNLASGRTHFNMGKAKREWQTDLDWMAREYAG
jgi:hypothetical protein